MAITDNERTKVKGFIKDAQTAFASMPPDIQQNIKPNRNKMLPFFFERLDIEKLSGKLPQHAQSSVSELSRLLYEYEHYFDNGYKSPENIDTLPDKIKAEFAKLSRMDM